MTSIRVIGVGNAWRGDDAVGLLAAHRLRGRWPPPVEVTVVEGDGLSLIEQMEGADHLVLIDAVTGGGRPGEVVRLDLTEERQWGRILPYSTHALGLAEAIDLAGTLGRAPKHVVFYGVVIESVEPGAPLSDMVKTGLDVLVERVNEEVTQLQFFTGRRHPRVTSEGSAR